MDVDTGPRVQRVPNRECAYAVRDAFQDGFKARRNKPAEMIAKYLDKAMRKGQKGKDDRSYSEDLDAALAHIARYGSRHTDAICTTDAQAAERFLAAVDSAGVYHNCSTRFADGFRYGFGAEVGISTQTLPPRGPVGLEGLVTYRYRLRGDGHIAADYASGSRRFTHRSLPL